MPSTVVVGGQWGDEAKGKVCSYLAGRDQIDLSIRAGLGPGAGHTVVQDGVEFRLRQTPAAFVRPDCRLALGAGTLISPAVFFEEVERLGLTGRITIDGRATVIEEQHRQADASSNFLRTVVGSTGSGHGPCLADRALRTARLVRDTPQLAPYVADVAALANEALDRGERVLVEGTNGFGLSVLYGTYPHTVSKDSTASTAAADVGLAPTRINEVVLVFKAYATRVGPGDLPRELSSEEIHERNWQEVATVTGRPRRVGAFDLESASTAVMLNDPAYIALTCLDRLDPAAAGVPYGRLPSTVRRFVDQVEDGLQRPVGLLSTGPDIRATIDRRGSVADPEVSVR
ncbi:adenylosuccinate synthetase [Kribbella speibonae]|uniref:Adenylosuccinate synthetase n=1 Tax=Kribbella speibonae TaxID=1572660 RepID=A0A4R0IXL9_9ACTN|nr:adenylosuccinate synthetase [Kribbella speibonae]TCC36308.1 adenylosuccinate synthetase [Kribbella speibonae]